jgi:predicted nucleic acid-binding protein
VYLIDTNVISEARKNTKANPGVTGFFKEVVAADEAVFLSSVSVGELRRGVELIRFRGDIDQALMLETWLSAVLEQFEGYILSFDADAAQLWGRLRAPHPEHELDKQIAAIALINDLTLVTRNMSDFKGTGVRLKNPFFPSSPAA